MKAVFRIALLVFCCCLWSAPGGAVTDWFVTSVVKVGIAADGEVMLKLSHSGNNPSFTAKWFAASDGVRTASRLSALANISRRRRVTLLASTSPQSIWSNLDVQSLTFTISSSLVLLLCSRDASALASSRVRRTRPGRQK